MSNKNIEEVTEEITYQPHELQPLVDMITGVIDNQLWLFNRLTIREHMPESPVDAKAWDDLYDERMVGAQTCIKIIRRFQDRLFKLSIDMELDGDLISFKEIKKKIEKSSQQTVNDDPQTQDGSE